jgi:uncharacterized membrane protein (GlpM family)
MHTIGAAVYINSFTSVIAYFAFLVHFFGIKRSVNYIAGIKSAINIQGAKL